RQVLAMVFGALCDRVVRRPLLRTNRSLIGKGLAAAMAIAGISAIALSDIWPILIVGALVGVFAGILKFGHDILSDTDRYPSARNAPVANPAKPRATTYRGEPAAVFQEIRRSEK